ncbi:opioid-binding protein/cell adhesion molecule homolog [Anopheles nili]|uniref:opioid-binding protein/cell adhesion molecule homolog n=1 Tax=Anopheles nili TaxID=185578 RepID=UPI00237BA36E|nr:opioid-binding protein/cell adhesion molecule homolog [Anopheles nili]
MDLWCKAFLLILLGTTSSYALLDVSGIDPKFSAPIANVTVPVGREGVMTCTVHDLYKYKVAWLRVDTQTILTIETLVITKSERIAITHTEQRIWQLRIKDIRESDKGWYMCQINTDPMKSQMGYLDVVVPPDILDYPTSQDMVVQEGNNVTLTCAATGVPEPTVTWKREGDKSLTSVEDSGITSHDGAMLHIHNVQRHNAGSYHCIASNGVPPTVSKRIIVTVNFQPIVHLPTRQYYADLGGRVALECFSESQPVSINYWMKQRDEVILPGGTYDATFEDHVHKLAMKLVVRVEKPADFGVYKCVAKNSLGTTEGSMKIYRKTSKMKQVETQFTQQTNFLGATTLYKNYTDNKMNDVMLTSASAASSSGTPRVGSSGWFTLAVAMLASVAL